MSDAIPNSRQIPLNYDYTDFAMESVRFGGFIETGIDLFESEELTETLFAIYLGMMARGWASAAPDTPMPLDNLAALYVRGLWLPCVQRVALECQVDTRNDGTPQYAALPILRSDNAWQFASARKIPALPRGWSAPGGHHAVYLAGVLYPRSSLDRAARRKLAAAHDVMEWDGWYFVLINDRLVPARDPAGRWPFGGAAAAAARFAAAALQTVSDFRSLWTVETEESVLGSERRTPLRIGVTEDIVKSLFYARQAPKASSGRRRPILHWVTAHKRRREAGIDIDVKKHLRGVTSFEMDGFPFYITEPVKKAARDG